MLYYYYVTYYVPSIHLYGNTELIANEQISSIEDTVLMKEALAREMNTGNGEFSKLSAFKKTFNAQDIIFFGFPQLIREES